MLETPKQPKQENLIHGWHSAGCEHNERDYPMTSVFSWREAVQQSGLKPTTRHVLLNLSTFMDSQGGVAWPSIDTQAKTTGLSNRAVITNIQHAVDAGFLVKRRRKYPNSKWFHSIYVAVYPSNFTFKSALDYPELPHEGDSLGEVSPHEPNDVHQVKEVLTTSPKNSPDKKNIKKRGSISLKSWEAENGELNIEHIMGWVVGKKLVLDEVRLLIEEFRTEMTMKDKRYADFKAAFQVYLTKGYLSKALSAVQIAGAPAQQGNVRTRTRGVSI